MLTQIIISLLIYPGLLLALGLSLLYTITVTGRLRLHRGAIGATWRSSEGLLYTTGIVLTGCALALLPWPLHPVQLGRGVWLWSWALFEGAFLLPLVPGLLANTPTVVRAASREAQIGVAGRALLWLALTAGLLFPFDQQLVILPAYLLIVLAAIFAFPAATGWGPFAAETTITPGGGAYGLDAGTTSLAAAARTIRMVGLLAASLIALLPRTVIPPLAGVLLFVAVFVGVSVLLKRMTGQFPRQPLPELLRICWWRTLPLALAAGVYLALVRG